MRKYKIVIGVALMLQATNQGTDSYMNRRVVCAHAPCSLALTVNLVYFAMK